MPDPTPAPPASPAPRTVNRAQLCAELGRSRQWVDAWITGDPSFPVLQRGAQGRPYVFDLARVRAYLEAEDRVTRTLDATSPQARLANIRADLAERDLADRMGKLVDTEGMRTVIAESVAVLRAINDRTIAELVRRHGLAAACERDFRTSMSALVDTLERDVGKALSPGHRHPSND